jgi:ABC-type glycerol-3-phosphate transport system substrate-binding protein
MKQKLIGFFFLIIIQIGFISCHKDAKTGAEIKIANTDNISQIKLRWLAQWYTQGAKETFIRETAREFMFLNQNIDIELVFPHEIFNLDPSASNSKYMTDTITKMVQQNNWPFDFMLCDGNLYSRVSTNLQDIQWGKEFLVDFKDKKWFVENHKNNFFKTEANTEVFSGIAPGAYIEGVYNILYVSSEVENRLGIKVKNYNMNMSDFTAYAKAVHEYNKTNSDKITFSVFPWDYATKFFSHIAISGLENDSPANRDESINALKQAYQTIEKIAEYMPLEQYDSIKNERELLHKKVLFYFHASWINFVWLKNNPEGEKLMRPCELPTLDNKTTSHYSGLYNCVFVVPKNTKNRAAAELLMEFISSKENAEMWTKYSKSPTGLKVRISESEFGSDDYAKFAQHINEKFQDEVISENLGLLLFKSTKSIDFQVANVMRGKISADDALKSVLRQIGAS